MATTSRAVGPLGRWSIRSSMNSCCISTASQFLSRWVGSAYTPMLDVGRYFRILEIAFCRHVNHVAGPEMRVLAQVMRLQHLFHIEQPGLHQLVRHPPEQHYLGVLGVLREAAGDGDRLHQREIAAQIVLAGFCLPGLRPRKTVFSKSFKATVTTGSCRMLA